MSLPKIPKPAKLVISLFMQDKTLIAPIAAELNKKFGLVDMISSWLPFDFTSYYESEMGACLFRRIFVFKTLIRQSDLVDIKLATNELEIKYSKNGKRLVNIDPGYMLQARFVLATGKDFAHRIYIGKGIYADLALLYTQGRFKTLPWTYPDYAEKNMLVFLEMVRSKYSFDLKQIS